MLIVLLIVVLIVLFGGGTVLHVGADLLSILLIFVLAAIAYALYEGRRLP